MKTFVGLFAGSSAFGLATALAYFFIAHEETVGTTMLAIVTAALAFCAGYALVAERDAALEGDRAGETPQAAAGTCLGIFTGESAWPPIVAACMLAGLLGAIWSPLLALIAVAGLAVALWRMGAESARV